MSKELGKNAWNSRDYIKNAPFVPALGEAVLQLLSPRPGERILDLGCGDGLLTQALVAAGADVVGIDASLSMVEAALGRGLNVFHADAEKLSFKSEFDAVFSNAALHWMNDVDAVIYGVKQSLKSGGRFVGEFGGQGNVETICTALVSVLNENGFDGAAKFPWYFPSIEEYAGKLFSHGFSVDSIESLPRLTPLPTGIEGWLKTFANPFFQGVPEESKTRIIAEVVRRLEPSLCDKDGNWSADYVRLRFSATIL